MTNPTFSIVAPIYNEIGNLPELYRRIVEVMESTAEAWELILVDDGSSDGSTDYIRNLSQQDPRGRAVIFARNFGHQIAVTAGLDYSRGKAAVIIDADLQDPPEVILDLIARWREGYQVVYAIRKEREGETWFKLFTAKLFYRLIYRITDVDIPMDTGDFRLLDRMVVNVLSQMRERHRFLRGMSVWVGFRQTGVPYKRSARYTGETKYPLKKMVKFARDAVTSFSYFPLQLATYMGFISAGLSILAVWTGIFLLNSGLGSLRRVIDPRIYLRIFARIAVYIAESCRSDGQTTSKAALRTELSREYISFLKGRIPDFIEQIFDMGGVVIALPFYDPRISLLCLTVTVPMIAIGRLYNHKVLRYQKEFHDERESVFAVLQMPKIQDVRDYHESMIRPQIRIADWGALSSVRFGSSSSASS